MSDALAAALFPSLAGHEKQPLSVQLKITARINPHIPLDQLCWAALDGVFTNAHDIAQAHDVLLGRGPRPVRTKA
jgi:hypothetical protein